MIVHQFVNRTNMKFTTWIKCGFRHSVGNVIASICGIIDNVAMLLTFGHFQVGLTTYWLFYRLKDGSWFDETTKQN